MEASEPCLTTLAPSPGLLQPVFESMTREYTLALAASVDTVSLGLAASSPDCAIFVNMARTDGSHRVDVSQLRESGLPIFVSVTAPGSAPATYVVSLAYDGVLPGGRSVSRSQLAPLIHQTSFRRTPTQSLLPRISVDNTGRESVPLSPARTPLPPEEKSLPPPQWVPVQGRLASIISIFRKYM